MRELVWRWIEAEEGVEIWTGGGRGGWWQPNLWTGGVGIAVETKRGSWNRTNECVERAVESCTRSRSSGRLEYVGTWWLQYNVSGWQPDPFLSWISSSFSGLFLCCWVPLTKRASINYHGNPRDRGIKREREPVQYNNLMVLSFILFIIISARRRRIEFWNLMNF